MKITIVGLSITSSWGNGHATTFRSLIKGLHQRGHEVFFLEKDVPWYASHRDMPNPPFCTVGLYSSLEELKEKYETQVATCDFVMVGSYVEDGISTCQWVLNTARGATAFYDIDTPVTMARLAANDCPYLSPEHISQFDIYFSFAGGPILHFIEEEYNAPRALPLYCSVDTELYIPTQTEKQWQLGYLGTYSIDRQPPLKELLLKPARQQKDLNFVVAGPQYPTEVEWPNNVKRIEHLPPKEHREFYNSQLFTLNITRQDMVNFGYSPSVRLFEAAACGVPIISDKWAGMEDFFEPEKEILLVSRASEVLQILKNTSAEQRQQIAERARQKVLRHHSSKQRASQLEEAVNRLLHINISSI